jgi:hypothetical protein
LKKVAIIQSNYLPWKGYFDIIHDVDLFVFHDDLKYTKQDWRNRNQLKNGDTKLWITLPVGAKAERLNIDQVTLSSADWQTNHWNLIKQTYGKAAFFTHYADFFEEVYLRRKWNFLSELNQYLIKAICGLLDVKTPFINSGDLNLPGNRTDKVINIVKAVGGTSYLSGPTAMNYIEKEKFESAGIELVFKSYEGYPEYPQNGFPFDHQVAIVDILFHTGPKAHHYIWGWREQTIMDKQNVSTLSQ